MHVSASLTNGSIRTVGNSILKGSQ